MKPLTRPGSILSGLALGLALITCAPSTRANIYATNIKINGGMTNAPVAQGGSVGISYILNEPATAGVTIRILSGTNLVRTISLTNGAPGTSRGLNTNVTWDAKDDSGHSVVAGSYSVAITAVSTGYAGWTLTTDDTNPGNNVYQPTGIAVDRNANSPYYGRVFAANSKPAVGAYLGYQVGILKCNADGSYADEGGFSTGGYAWAGDGASPWKLRVSDDDYVYVNDWTSNGEIYRFDPAISDASRLHVLSSNNWAHSSFNYVNLNGPAIWGTGTNTEIWMADNGPHGANTLGILRYSVSADGTCSTNDKGTVMVSVGGDLSIFSVAVALDPRHNIYTMQVGTNGDLRARVLRFAADPSTNSNHTFPELTADWTAGSGGGADWDWARGVAVDPTGAYLAVSFLGTGGGPVGNTKILSTANGAVITNLDLGVNVSGYTQKKDSDVDWDAVGNVYLVDGWYGCWRAYSPPGTNQATTKALAVVQVAGLTPPTITSITVSNGVVTIHFTAGPNDPASDFALLSCSNVHGSYSPVPGAVITGSGGSYQAVAPTNGVLQFYEIQRITAAPQSPLIGGIRVSGGIATISFTGASSDSASAFTLLSSSTIRGTYAAAGATITGSGGSYQATVPASGPQQFYRLRR